MLKVEEGVIIQKSEEIALRLTYASAEFHRPPRNGLDHQYKQYIERARIARASHSRFAHVPFTGLLNRTVLFLFFLFFYH